RTAVGHTVAEFEQFVAGAVSGALLGHETALHQVGEQAEGGRGRDARPAGDIADAHRGVAAEELVEQLECLPPRGRAAAVVARAVDLGRLGEALFFHQCGHADSLSNSSAAPPAAGRSPSPREVKVFQVTNFCSGWYSDCNDRSSEGQHTSQPMVIALSGTFRSAARPKREHG